MPFSVVSWLKSWFFMVKSHFFIGKSHEIPMTWPGEVPLGALTPHSLDAVRAVAGRSSGIWKPRLQRYNVYLYIYNIIYIII
jgi:hypothetical protein